MQCYEEYWARGVRRVLCDGGSDCSGKLMYGQCPCTATVRRWPRR